MARETKAKGKRRKLAENAGEPSKAATSFRKLERKLKQTMLRKKRMLSLAFSLVCFSAPLIICTTIGGIHGNLLISVGTSTSSDSHQPIAVPTTSESSTDSETSNLSGGKTVEDETSTGSIEDFIDSNYLVTGLVDAHISQSPEFMLGKENENSSNNILSNKLLPPNASKNNRKSEYTVHQAADWWTKINPKPAKKSTQTTNDTGKTNPNSASNGDEGFGKVGKRDDQREDYGDKRVYREQPLNQNIILTTRNQLLAIRAKHKILVTRSVRQLSQLDNRLIDSYKLCLKKNMPLYAGMLYRTRDFVVNMAKEVKHERKVLEAITKQVQGVLRQKMSNRTLVREYNKLIAASAEPDIWRPQPHRWQQHSTTLEVESNQQASKATAASPNRTKKVISSQQQPKDVQQQSPESTADDSVSWLTKGSRKWRSTQKPSAVKGSKEAGFKSSTGEIETTTNWPTKAMKYTVKINEVNLRKELSKTQALIDRINGSTHELTSVVDDIIYLFKLTTDPNAYKKGLSFGNKMNKFHNEQAEVSAAGFESDQSLSLIDKKRSRKMLKSPVRVFLEKYGKLTMANIDNLTRDSNDKNSTSSSELSNYDSNTVNLPDVKPVFGPSSLVYSEPGDLDSGAPSDGE